MGTIAIIGPRGLPKDFVGTSGIEGYVEAQLPELVKRYSVRCYVRSWTHRHECQPTVYGAKLVRIPSINNPYLDTISYSLIASIHASLSPANIVWYHGIGPAVFSFIPRLFHKQVYTTIHALDWKRKKWGSVAKLFLKFCETVTLVFSNKIFVVSKGLAEHYRAFGKGDITLAKYIAPTGLKTQGRATLKKYGLKKNQYILYMGRFVPEKRIEWLVSASAWNSLPIVIAGGANHPSEYENILRQSAVGKNVLFTGYVLGDEKFELLSNCRFFVLPSEIEGFPIGVAEALEFGRTCLVGDFLRGEYDHTQPITFFKTRDYNDFLKQFLRLSHNP